MGLKDPYRNIGILVSWWICGRHCLGYMFHSKISQLMFLSPDCTGLVLPPPRKHWSQNFYVVVSICIFLLKSEVYRCFLTSTEWVSSILEAYFPFFFSNSEYQFPLGLVERNEASSYSKSFQWIALRTDSSFFPSSFCVNVNRVSLGNQRWMTQTEFWAMININ